MVLSLALVGLALVPGESVARTYKIATGVPDGVALIARRTWFRAACRLLEHLM